MSRVSAVHADHEGEFVVHRMRFSEAELAGPRGPRLPQPGGEIDTPEH